MAEVTDSSQRIGEGNNEEALKAELFRRKPGLTKRRIIGNFPDILSELFSRIPDNGWLQRKVFMNHFCV